MGPAPHRRAPLALASRTSWYRLVARVFALTLVTTSIPLPPLAGSAHANPGGGAWPPSAIDPQPTLLAATDVPPALPLAGIPSVLAAQSLVFGPERFIRDNCKPVTGTRSFALAQPSTPATSATAGQSYARSDVRRTTR